MKYKILCRALSTLHIVTSNHHQGPGASQVVHPDPVRRKGGGMSAVITFVKISPFNAMTGFQNLHQVVCQNLYLCKETFKFDSSTLKASYLGERQSQLTTTAMGVRGA